MEEQNKNIIKIKLKIPNTHFFIYQNHQYPFNFDFFKYSSKLISRNANEFERSKEIKLLDDEEIIPNLTKEVIEYFIKYAQQESISLTNENVIPLNYFNVDVIDVFFFF